MKVLLTVLLLAATGVNALPAKSAPKQQKRWDTDLVSDISVISNYWGQIRPYADNTPDYFGVKEVGLPNGCGVEQLHILHRHGARYATSTFDDGGVQSDFADKVAKATKSGFNGPLDFLSGYSYQLSDSGLLVSTGAAQEFTSGTQFWNNYGRLLYGAQPGQPYYNQSFTNGTARPKPVFRTTSQPRIIQSAEFWAQGFFGFHSNVSSLYDLVSIPEAVTNNTLASYYSCDNDDYVNPIVYAGDYTLENYIPIYLADAVERLKPYFPSDFDLNANDTYAMQSLCAYETNTLGSSDFCGLFTLQEWEGFEYTLDVEYYYDYAFGNPTGRAQGIGYVQELIARLNKEYIDVSFSSVNSTLDNNGKTFPLDQVLYMDMSHDDILISVLVSMGFDYLKGDLPVTADHYPPPADRKFILSHLTPFGARLTTEVIGCSSSNPTPKQYAETHYTQSTNGYDAKNAPNKFVRMKLNNGVLPLTELRGGSCTRSDGLCAVDAFKSNLPNWTAQANYQFVCFGNNATVQQNFNNDGTSFA